MRLDRDYIKRLVKQLADAVARITSLRQAGELDEAQRAVEQACSDALGLDYLRLSALDVQSLGMVLGSNEKREGYATLLRQEAAIAKARGQTAQAEALSARAETLEQR